MITVVPVFANVADMQLTVGDGLVTLALYAADVVACLQLGYATQCLQCKAVRPVGAVLQLARLFLRVSLLGTQ